MTTFQAISIMIAFSMLNISIVSLVVAILSLIKKK